MSAPSRPHRAGTLLFHCVAGKDRTGLVAARAGTCLFFRGRPTRRRFAREYAMSSRHLRDGISGVR